MPNRNLHQQFYQNRVLDRYSVQEPKKVSLRQLVLFGRQLTEDKLLSSANYVRTELPVRLSHRIRDFQSLPYIAGTNPHIRFVYDLYWQSFDEIRKFPPIRSLNDNRQFCEMLSRNLSLHAQVIPRLGLGLSECLALVASAEIDQFMNQMLVSRISRRTLAEQHIAISEQFDQDIFNTFDQYGLDHAPKGFSTQRTGIVDPACDIAQLLHNCAIKVQAHFEEAYDLPPDTTPQVIIEGHRDALFMCIPDNIEYIFYELLKNSNRAVIESYKDRPAALAELPPIVITICSSVGSDIKIRISDQGGGIPYEVLPHIWSFSSAEKFHRLENLSHVQRLEARIKDSQSLSPFLSFGFGLPMSRVYARYWGGDISIQSLPGYGVDAYITLPRLGTMVENLSVAPATVAQAQSTGDGGAPSPAAS
ncbi:[Pyruvate dehydrogenase (acetyl-transferring)] kinase 2, mitochondrial [Spiromyces aspiralis]|uniref:[Pyruvate dehydrogenase (Acetyl-transferring)] kinase 2, mitochondrial n=1 Tax=Spiromyces aspiralis TaxID=68401 RepID=A0ACC1I1Y9_9FUNG|nr:[Pyruvate dehydrogenase (acetyl-transferring)] kinase 2, mitochondrial [Spiromyces aspiralis]